MSSMLYCVGLFYKEIRNRKSNSTGRTTMNKKPTKKDTQDQKNKIRGIKVFKKNSGA